MLAAAPAIAAVGRAGGHTNPGDRVPPAVAPVPDPIVAAGTGGRWSAPGLLSACPETSAPQVIFPSDSPSHGTGPGAVVWGAARACPGGEGARVAPIGAGDVPAGVGEEGADAPHRLDLRGALIAARAPRGKIVIAGGTPAEDRVGALLREGSAAGPFAPLASSEGQPGPIALASGYLGDVALLAAVQGAPGEEGLRLRVQRYYADGFGHWIGVSGARAGPIASLTSAMDYRSDVLAVWWQEGAIDAREVPAGDIGRPVQRLATAAAGPELTALLSDDDHGIVAWSERRRGETSVYLDVSRRGVRFGPPRLVEHFADPDGADLPAVGVHLVRLSSESVLMVWAGAAGGRWVVRAAAIELGGPGPISTLAAPGGDAQLAAVAAGPRDEALALWSEPQPSAVAGPVPSSALFAARVIEPHPAGTVFGAPEQLAPPGAYADATLAIDPDSGRGLAVWEAGGGSLEYSIRTPRPARSCTAPDGRAAPMAAFREGCAADGP